MNAKVKQTKTKIHKFTPMPLKTPLVGYKSWQSFAYISRAMPFGFTSNRKHWIATIISNDIRLAHGAVFSGFSDNINILSDT